MDKLPQVSRVSVPLDVAEDLPIFAGHFPGAPLVPGALQLEWMLRSLPGGEDASVCWTVKNAKFLKPLLPGTRASIHFEAIHEGFRCEVNSPDGTHATAIFLRKTR